MCSEYLTSDFVRLQKRIQTLERAAQKTRLKLVRLLALILVTKNKALAGQPYDTMEAAQLEARYAVLKLRIGDLEGLIDRLYVEEHEKLYG